MSTTLAKMVDALGAIAPLRYAEPWDRVGLLIEPSRARRISHVLLTIDLTEPVMREAIRARAELIVAYHPPIFDPLPAVTTADWKQRIVQQAIENRIAVYAPHTALDAAPGGVNDWLAEALGPHTATSISPGPPAEGAATHKIVVFVPADHADRLRKALAAHAGRIGNYAECSFETPGTGTFRGTAGSSPAVGRRGRLERVPETRLEMVCSGGDALAHIEHVIRETHPYEEPAWDVYPLTPPTDPSVGQGRDVALARPATLPAIITRLKKHLGIPKVRVATADRHRRGRKLSRVLLCAGAGGSVLAGRAADLYITGEMRHHDVLAAVADGTSVILTDHTNTERPYLPVLRRRLAAAIDRAARITIARADAEPLRIV